MSWSSIRPRPRSSSFHSSCSVQCAVQRIVQCAAGKQLDTGAHAVSVWSGFQQGGWQQWLAAAGSRAAGVLA